MKFMVFVFLVVLSVVRAQFNYIGFMSPWSNAFAPQGNSLSGLQAVRDPRLNTGPVVFPSPPPNAIEENSGVVVGASGYGFVPPNSQGPQVVVGSKVTVWQKAKRPGKNYNKKKLIHDLKKVTKFGKWIKDYGKKHHHSIEIIPEPHIIEKWGNQRQACGYALAYCRKHDTFIYAHTADSSHSNRDIKKGVTNLMAELYIRRYYILCFVFSISRLRYTRKHI